MMIDRRPEESWKLRVVREHVVQLSVSWKVKHQRAEFLLFCVNEDTVKGFYSNVFVLEPFASIVYATAIFSFVWRMAISQQVIR